MTSQAYRKWFTFNFMSLKRIFGITYLFFAFKLITFRKSYLSLRYRENIEMESASMDIELDIFERSLNETKP